MSGERDKSWAIDPDPWPDTPQIDRSGKRKFGANTNTKTVAENPDDPYHPLSHQRGSPTSAPVLHSSVFHSCKSTNNPRTAKQDGHSTAHTDEFSGVPTRTISDPSNSRKTKPQSITPGASLLSVSQRVVARSEVKRNDFAEIVRPAPITRSAQSLTTRPLLLSNSGKSRGRGQTNICTRLDSSLSRSETELFQKLEKKEPSKKRTQTGDDDCSDGFVNPCNTYRKSLRLSASKRRSETVDLVSDDEEEIEFAKDDNDSCEHIENYYDFVDIMRSDNRTSSSVKENLPNRFIFPIRAHAKAIIANGLLYFPQKRNCRLDLGNDYKSIELSALGDFQDEIEGGDPFAHHPVSIGCQNIQKVHRCTNVFHEDGCLLKIQIQDPSSVHFPEQYGKSISGGPHENSRCFEIILFTNLVQCEIIVQMIEIISKNSDDKVFHLLDFELGNDDKLLGIVEILDDISKQKIFETKISSSSASGIDSRGRRLSRRSSTSRVEIGKHPDDSIVVLQYPFVDGAQDIITLTKGDVRRLEPPEYLNDNLIDFKIKLLMSTYERENPSGGLKVHVCNSLFFTKLCEKNRVDDGYELVKRWTKNVDIFNFDLIIIPINEGNHWSLFVVVRPGSVGQETFSESENRPCTLFMDSLGLHSPTKIYGKMQRYLDLEWKDKKMRVLGDDPESSKVPDFLTRKLFPMINCGKTIPHQQNGYDCGVYVIKFFEMILKSFSTSTLEDIENGFSGQFSPLAFGSDDIDRMRREIGVDITNLASGWLVAVEERKKMEAVEAEEAKAQKAAAQDPKRLSSTESVASPDEQSPQAQTSDEGCSGNNSRDTKRETSPECEIKIKTPKQKTLATVAFSTPNPTTEVAEQSQSRSGRAGSNRSSRYHS